MNQVDTKTVVVFSYDTYFKSCAVVSTKLYYYVFYLFMLQGQYIALEKKYCKNKRLLREFQQRESDLLHREDFFMQLLQEKDTEYNALVKALKDRVNYS